MVREVVQKLSELGHTTVEWHVPNMHNTLTYFMAAALAGDGRLSGEAAYRDLPAVDNMGHYKAVTMNYWVGNIQILRHHEEGREG